MRTVALVVNTDKPLAIAAGRDIITWLEDRSIRVMMRPEDAEAVGRGDLALLDTSAMGAAEMVIVLGGDGTLIRAAKTAAPLQVPILGVNQGNLGFLTELESAELFDHLEQFLEGDCAIDQRMMVVAQVIRNGEVLHEVVGLNDAVVAKGPRARLVHLEVSIGETSVARYPADGVIVATPTGSTAYSLSAGGPIVGPTVDVLLVTPICPHTMNTRAMVVSGHEQVTVTVRSSPGDVGLSVDGSEPISLRVGDQVRVSRAPHTARLIRRHGYHFYDVLGRKLGR